MADAYSRVITGKCKSTIKQTPVHLMWSSISTPSSPEKFRVNHFVPLVRNVCVDYESDTHESVQDVSNESVISIKLPDYDSFTYKSVLDASTESVNVDRDYEESKELTDEARMAGEVTDSESLNRVTECDKTDETSGRLNVFMDTATSINILTQGITGRNEIPGGVKENVYFVLDNSTNTNMRKIGKRSDFPDDCGIWNGAKGSSPKMYYVKFGSIYRQVYMKDGLLHYRKKTKGHIKHIPYDPQPEESMVFPVQRYYATLKKDDRYKKRVTWLTGYGHSATVAIVEYVGTFPGLAVHGNSTSGTEYVRVPPKVMGKITEMTGKMKPHQIYNKLSYKYDELTQPTSLRQVHDKQYRDRQNERTLGHMDNFADQIRYVENLVTENSSYVRSVIRTSGRTPSIILFTDEQIDDIKNMCCTGNTVLGIDKIFMLCKMHVTVTCYKQLSVKSYKTGQHPIFLGPLLIHDSSDFETFSYFLYHLRLKLHNVSLSKLVIGSDDEKALVKALNTVFPDSTHVLCTRHLEENARHVLTDDTVTKAQKQRVLKRIFGDGGLKDAKDTVCYEDMASDIAEELSGVSEKFRQYFDKRLVTTLKEKVNDPQRHNKVIKSWTNNNCEAINHVLKQTTDWKSQPLPDLVRLTHDLVIGQIKKLRCALLQKGDFRLSDSHRQFERSKTDWIKMTEQQMSNHYRRYRKYVPTDGKIVTSTDAKTTVVAPKTNGRKPGQRKRKAKTVTLKSKIAKTGN